MGRVRPRRTAAAAELLLPLLLLVLVGCGSRAAPPRPAEPTPAADASAAPADAGAPATPPTALDPIDELAGHYAPACGIGAWNEVTLEGSGRFRWLLHGCTGEHSYSGRVERKGRTVTLVPEPAEAGLEKTVFVAAEHDGRSLLLREEEVAIFELSPTLRLGMVKLSPGEGRLALCAGLPAPSKNPTDPAGKASPLPVKLALLLRDPGQKAPLLKLEAETGPHNVLLSGCRTSGPKAPCADPVVSTLGGESWVELNRLWWRTAGLAKDCPPPPSSRDDAKARRFELSWEGGGFDGALPEPGAGDPSTESDPCRSRAAVAAWLEEQLAHTEAIRRGD